MADSLEKIVRAEIVTWISGLGIVLTSTRPITYSAEAPLPGTLPALPTVAVWFASTEWEIQDPEIVEAPAGVGVYRMGDIEADAEVIWRVSDFGDVEEIRDQYRRLSAISAINSNPHGQAVVVLPVTIFGVDARVRIYLTGTDQLAAPDQTIGRDFWILRYSATVAYPWLAQETAPGTGLMDIIVDLDVNETGAPGPFDLNDYQPLGGT